MTDERKALLKDILSVVLSLALLIGMWGLIFRETRRCEGRGGEYVRTAVWFSCVDDRGPEASDG